MAFPSIGAVLETRSTSLITSHTVNLPSGITAGQLLIVDFNWGDGSALTWPAGWTHLYESTIASYGKSIRYRIADGSETTVVLTTASPTRGIHLAMRIVDYDSAVAPAVASTSGASANPDCPNLDPANWGAEDTLWLALYGWDTTDSIHTAYPANYNLHQSSGVQSGTDGCGRGFAARQLNASVENPGQATLDGAESWLAVTIAIKPVVAIPLAPSPVAIPITAPAPQIIRNQSLAPSAIAVPLENPAPAVTPRYPVAPDALPVPIAVAAPVVTVHRLLSPDAVAVSLAITAPTITFEQVISPLAVSVPLSAPTPIVQSGQVLEPSSVLVPIATPAPALTKTY